jgi:5-methylthioribose kinase
MSEKALLHSSSSLSTVVPVASTPAGFRRLTEDAVGEYVIGVKKLKDLLQVNSASELSVREVGDGNLNYVYIVTNKEDNTKAVVVKQALPYIRCVGESWPLTLERATFETNALREERRHCQEYVPEVYHFDSKLALIAMRFVEPPHIILRKALIARQALPQVADHLSSFLASTLFSTSFLNLSGGEFRLAVSRWSRNNAMCALTEKVIFTDPYMEAPTNRWTPQLEHYAKSIRNDTELKLAAEKLKIKFVSSAEALLHGDLHTGSVMVTESSTFVIDPEFAFYGPIGFDVGAILSNLLLSYFSQGQHGSAAEAYSEWILKMIESLYTMFSDKFKSKWSEKWGNTSIEGSQGEIFQTAVYGRSEMEAAQAAFMSQLWRDSLGFSGAKMIRRIVGIAHVADLDSIADSEVRAKCEAKALRMARRLVVASSQSGERAEIENVQGMIALAREIYNADVDFIV